MRPALIGLAAAAAAVVCTAALVRSLSRPGVRGDGIGYYAPVASILIDHDLELGNEYQHADASVRRRWLTLPDGRLVDPYPVGAGILWMPVLGATWLTDPRRDQYGNPDRWRFSSPGFAPRYLKAIAWATGLEAIVAAFVLYRSARRRTGPPAAAIGTLAALVGTPLVYYTLAEPSYAHTASFLAAAALLAMAVRGGTSRGSIVALGALWGLVSLVRSQDIVLGVLAAPRLLEEWRRRGPARRETALRLALFGLAALVVFSPQILFWQRIYGRPLVYIVSSDFMHWTQPALVPFLFSTWQGALLWSPVVGLGIVGIRWWPGLPLRIAMWIAVALEIYASAAAGDWWGSSSFGARRLVVVAPIFGLGVAAFVERGLQTYRQYRKPLALAWRIALVAVCIGWNLRLAQYAVRGALPKNTGNAADYVRDFPAGDPHRVIWGHWDYGRLAGELWDAERRMWSQGRAAPPPQP